MNYVSFKRIDGGWVLSINAIDTKVFTDSDLLVNELREIIRQQELHYASR